MRLPHLLTWVYLPQSSELQSSPPCIFMLYITLLLTLTCMFTLIIGYLISYLVYWSAFDKSYLWNLPEVSFGNNFFLFNFPDSIWFCSFLFFLEYTLSIVFPCCYINIAKKKIFQMKIWLIWFCAENLPALYLLPMVCFFSVSYCRIYQTRSQKNPS